MDSTEMGVRSYEMANLSTWTVYEWASKCVCLLNAYGKRGNSLGILHKWNHFKTINWNQCLPHTNKRNQPKNLVHFLMSTNMLDSFSFDGKCFLSHTLHIYQVPIYLGNWVIVNVRMAKVFVVKYKYFSVIEKGKCKSKSKSKSEIEWKSERSVLKLEKVPRHVKMLWRVSNIRNFWFFGTKMGAIQKVCFHITLILSIKHLTRAHPCWNWANTYTHTQIQSTF